MSTTQSAEVIVRGRCSCGKRFKIRNATVETAVSCPHCGSLITVTHADLEIAQADAELVPLAGNQVRPRFVLPIDEGELTVAPRGSKPGLTGRSIFNHEEAIFGDYVVHGFTRNTIRGVVARRGLVADVLGTFMFAGHGANFAATMLVAGALAGLIWLFATLPGDLRVLVVLFAPLLVVYVMHFCWTTLSHTAAGQDMIDWNPVTADLAHEAVRPLFVFTVLAVLATAPAIVLDQVLNRDDVLSDLMLLLVLFAGWTPVPAALLLLALNRAISAFSPLKQLRMIKRIGAPYLIPWSVMLVTLGAAVALSMATRHAGLMFGAALVFSLLLVAFFRTLGLIYRHFPNECQFQRRPTVSE